MAAPNPEKQPIPPQGEQYFPPPPPGPPPSHSGQAPTYPPPPGQDAQQHASYPPIPQYNPADPQFAPPINEPTTAPATAAAASTSTDSKPPPSPSDAAKKHGWSERLAALGQKAADPINALANKLGSQGFLPTTLDKECEKAAAILRQFCKEGVETEGGIPGETTLPAETADGKKHDKTKKPQKAIVTIPAKVIAKAQGLAIFTTARIGFQISGATGSGVVLARLPDGSWGPPSGIQVLSVGAGFLIGADIYDCVCVINSKDALQAFTNSRVSLGTDLAVAAGPYGAGGALDVGRALATEKPDGVDRHGDPVDSAANTTGLSAAQQQQKMADESRLQAGDGKKPKRRSSSASLTKPVFYYVKSRGLYAGVAIDGTAINERKEANAAFYGSQVPVEKILKGEVPRIANATWQASVGHLHEALRAAETGKRASYNAPAATAAAGTSAAGLQSVGATKPAPVMTPTTTAPLPAGERPGQHPAPQHDEKPGFVSVPLTQGTGQQQGAPSFPPPPTAAEGEGGAPPAYVDDGQAHGTGDQKTTYH